MRTLSTIILAVFCAAVMAQEKTDSVYSQKSTDSLYSKYNIRQFSSISFDPIFNIASGNTRGLRFSVVGNVVQTHKGMQLAAISNVASNARGLQLACFSNVNMSPLHGIQLAGVSNVSQGLDRGLQLSAISNVVGGEARGLQMGVYNYADTLNGVQIGIFNSCVSNPRGTQIGIVNYSRENTPHRRYGLINIHPSTQFDLMAYAGTSSKANFGVRFVNGNVYNIVGVGAWYQGLSDKFNGSVFYRLGYRLPIGKDMHIGGDIGYYHIENFRDDDGDEKDERYFSIQPRVTYDWQFSRNFGAYAAVGFDATHRYGGGTLHNRPIAELGLTYTLRPAQQLLLKPLRTKPSYTFNNDSTGKHPWIAAAEVLGINVFVHCYDRFVAHEDYANTTLTSIRRNFQRCFVWDNDFFNTNQFMHPYHGNLYFNAARSNGLTFWESMPYALGGSLTWEFFGENSPPSINDLFSTSIGGTAIGETFYRLSSLMLDDSSRGTERFFREALSFIINPIRGLNRLIRGEAWRYRPNAARYHDYDKLPISLETTVGMRYISDNGKIFHGAQTGYLNVHFDYGDIISEENKPFDYFNADITASFGGGQPLISDIHLLGMWWGHNFETKSQIKIGFFQHFNFYNSEPIEDGGQVPFRVSETASIGPGVIFHFSNFGSMEYLEQRVFVNCIFMGGSYSDHFRILERDYNLGSGYSAKVQTRMRFKRYARLAFDTEFYHLFTWKGYDENILETIEDKEYVNAQGCKGNTAMLVLKPHLQVNLTRNWLLDIRPTYFLRHTHYSDFNNCTSHTFQICAGVTYAL